MLFKWYKKSNEYTITISNLWNYFLFKYSHSIVKAFYNDSRILTCKTAFYSEPKPKKGLEYIPFDEAESLCTLSNFAFSACNIYAYLLKKVFRFCKPKSRL